MLQYLSEFETEYKIKTISVDGGVKWFNACQCASALGYANTNKAIKDHVDMNDKTICRKLIKEDFLHELSYNQQNTIYINRHGVMSLILKSKLPKSVAVAEKCGVHINHKYLRKETEIILSIQEFLTTLNISFEFQKTISSYRIDLYIPEYKIVIEIDEEGHKDRCVKYERKREQIIQDKLECSFLRFNPDAKTFSLVKCLAELSHALFRR